MIDNYAMVECVSKSACGSCASADNCGNSAIAKAFPTRVHQLQVKLTEAVEVGDNVELALNAKNMLQSAVIVYLLPLGMLIIGAALGKVVTAQGIAGEWVIALSTLTGLALGFLTVRRFTGYFSRHARYRPKMLAKQ
ncbi:SoxR reducing system RseC family protein [Agarivorans litoreus]|uniref:SoxR reducing system RseC family protein n=1 Tax=Agarivorans litoreus TaxID=1510455 RepID=UPI001C7DE435|nr:SoxR reducing system RseC family protein [Agarivorans litoreus]